jgi:uncharacterized repeat protein (TIGR03987 family)
MILVKNITGLSGSALTTELVVATIFISLALILYSIGVWSERIAGRLKKWHLIFFWAGLICDTTGTGLMFDAAGGITSDIHSITGIIAIVLMLVHAVWATIVLLLKNEQAIMKFHYFSVFVWIIWLIPYLNGFFASMR